MMALMMIAIGWMYVVVLMAIAEASSAHGSVLAAFSIVLFYGALPLSIILYIVATPIRKRMRQAKETMEQRQSETATQLEENRSDLACDSLGTTTTERAEPINTVEQETSSKRV